MHFLGIHADYLRKDKKQDSQLLIPEEHHEEEIKNVLWDSVEEFGSILIGIHLLVPGTRHMWLVEENKV